MKRNWNLTEKLRFLGNKGVPVLQASHCGSFKSGFMLIPGLSLSVPYHTEFVGCTQIVDAYGCVLAQRQAQEGPGVVTARVSLGAIEPRIPIEDNFWIPNLPLTVKMNWHQQNACGKSFYRKQGRRLGLANAEKIARERDKAQM